MQPETNSEKGNWCRCLDKYAVITLPLDRSLCASNIVKKRIPIAMLGGKREEMSNGRRKREEKEKLFEKVADPGHQHCCCFTKRSTGNS